MPIYSYKCNACGHQSDVLQKMSDAPLTKCPACGKDSYSKQLTAAGFVLKGGGWYVTDFKDQKGKGQDKKQNTQGEKKVVMIVLAKGKTMEKILLPPRTMGIRNLLQQRKKIP